MGMKLKSWTFIVQLFICMYVNWPSIDVVWPMALRLRISRMYAWVKSLAHSSVYSWKWRVSCGSRNFFSSRRSIAIIRLILNKSPGRYFKNEKKFPRALATEKQEKGCFPRVLLDTLFLFPVFCKTVRMVSLNLIQTEQPSTRLNGNNMKPNERSRKNGKCIFKKNGQSCSKR